MKNTVTKVKKTAKNGLFTTKTQHTHLPFLISVQVKEWGRAQISIQRVKQ